MTVLPFRTARHPYPNGSTSMSPFYPVRVLIADDHAPTRMNLHAILQSEFQVCGEAKDGKEAVQKAGETKPDVVVLDIVMPSMDGLAAQAIKEVSPSTKIIFTSLHVFGRDEHLTARLLGASAFVPKAQAAYELVPAIKGLCRQQ